MWDSAAGHVRELLPGVVMMHSPQHQPAAVNPWPTYTSADQQHAYETGVKKQVVRRDSTFVVLGTAMADELGNAWCLCIAQGQVGWVCASDLITGAEWRVLAPQFFGT